MALVVRRMALVVRRIVLERRPSCCAARWCVYVMNKRLPAGSLKPPLPVSHGCRRALVCAVWCSVWLAWWSWRRGGSPCVTRSCLRCVVLIDSPPTFRCTGGDAALGASFVLSSVDAANAEFQRYAKIGQDIADDPAIDAILAAVNKVRDGEASATPPFVFVDGSSGVGKTQAAFALRARGQLVHHLLLSKVGDDSQPIYKALRPLSNAFVAQLEKDLDVLRRATDSDPLATATLEVFAAPLASAGFLLALLCGNKEGRRATVLALREAVGSLAADTRRAVVFVLDEVDVKGDNGRLLLARNLLRACGLPVVLMGTNATAASCVAGGSQTRVGDTMWPWAHVFVRLPRVTPRLAASLPSGLEA
ncbi:hypothetical protein DAPPUDRAFT_124754, partial [Daphnia pulex]